MASVLLDKSKAFALAIIRFARYRGRFMVSNSEV